MDEAHTIPGNAISLDDAFRYCERLAKTHYENFTVGSLLIPKALRRHVHAIYAYCRWVDDLGDEPFEPLVESLAGANWMYEQVRSGSEPLGPSQRMALLDSWEEELESCFTGTPTHPAMIALRDTVHAFGIPMEPFLKLIEANRMEQSSSRYSTYEDLLFYCDHSANPVGHLFLYLFGYSDKGMQELSDYTCTALQLANFWQDVHRDYEIGRIYLPLEDMERYGYTEAELAQHVVNRSFRDLMAFEVERAEHLFQRGLPLVDMLEGKARIDVALFTKGGMAVLEAIKDQDYDVLSRRPSLSRWKKARLFLSTWARMTRRPSAS